MEEINILDIIKFFKKRILVVILSALVFFIMGALYTVYFQTPKYQSQTTLLLLKANEDINNTYTQNDVLMNQNLITTYSEIIKSKKVLNKVSSILGLDISLDDLNEMITVASQKNSIIIAITVTSENKMEAANIANKVADVFSMEIQTLLNMQNVGIVDRATVAKEAYNVSPLKQLVLSTAIGILLSVSVLFVIYYFDNTVKTDEQIEKQIELPVIGIIPEKKRSSKWEKR